MHCLCRRRKQSRESSSLSPRSTAFIRPSNTTHVFSKSGPSFSLTISNWTFVAQSPNARWTGQFRRSPFHSKHAAAHVLFIFLLDPQFPSDIGVPSSITMAGIDKLISVHPEELTFPFELEKQSYCDLKIANKTEKYVAFKVKTTSPKKYFVRPKTGVIQPWDSSVIRVTLRPQEEYPPGMQCKDKFLLQCTIVTPQAEVDDLPADTFNKDSGKTIEECELRVVYVSSQAAVGNTEDRSFHNNSNQAIRQLEDERDAAVQQTQRLMQELELVKRRRSQKSEHGLSLILALVAGLICIMVGFILSLLLSSSSP
ncbi:hypothetical protein NMG60_11027404 [Bertholletia excelsa]